MKRFLFTVSVILIFIYSMGEVVVRTFNFNPQTAVSENINGYYSLKKNQTGVYRKGGLPVNFESNFRINNYGYNSLIDYEFNSNNSNKIGILGDSFIEGFQVDVDKSIGRLLEKELESKNIVYEFGFSANNLLNNIETYEKFNLNKFQTVFLFLDLDDIHTDIPHKTPFNSYLAFKELHLRNFYDYFKFIKFLNFNHEIIRKLKSGLNFGVKSIPIKVTNNCNDSNHHKTLLNFIAKNKNVVVVLKNDIEFFKSILGEIEYIEIIHDLKPFSFGYDMHWNLNGRKNVVNSIMKWVNQKK